MIRLIEAMNYRCLHRVRQPLNSFQVLVGPNSSGKSSFLDILGFLGRLASDGLEAAISERAASIHDLFWQRSGSRFELAVEAVLPEDKYPPIDLVLEGEGYAIRYEIAVGLDESGEARVLDEQILLSRNYFGPNIKVEYQGADTIFLPPNARMWKDLITYSRPRNEYTVRPEVPGEEIAGALRDSYRTLHRPTGNRLVFQGLSEGEFPTAIWLEDILRHHVVSIDLSSSELRKPSRPGQAKEYSKTGSNLPWLISGFEEQSPERYQKWIAHVRQALPGVQGIRVVERPEDRYRYLMLRYTNGLEVPSWMLSDGTLRLLALTLIAYLPGEGTIYLIEEPETSIHPLNIEVVTQSLSSVYEGQVLASTHSPTVLSVTKPEDVLVFSHSEETGTQIVRGSEHPGLRQWKGQPNLSVLYASGVLG